MLGTPQNPQRQVHAMLVRFTQTDSRRDSQTHAAKKLTAIIAQKIDESKNR